MIKPNEQSIMMTGTTQLNWVSLLIKRWINFKKIAIYMLF